jgi:hypothetical protein
MHKKMWIIFTGLCGLMTVAALAASARAQEVKPKPPMYSYVAEWQVPRDKWPDIEKTSASLTGVLEKAAADGTLVGYGHDEAIVHSAEGSTHDNWWSAMSMAGLVKVLAQVRANTNTAGSAMSFATKHEDHIYVSRYYNKKPGAYKDAYTRVALYKFKESAPNDALDQLSQHLIVPAMEKLFADGTVLEYEVDTEAVHSDDPSMFALVFQTTTPEGLDKVQAAIQDTGKEHPLAIAAFGSQTEDSAHRDYLMKGDGAYK